MKHNIQQNHWFGRNTTFLRSRIRGFAKIIIYLLVTLYGTALYSADPVFRAIFDWHPNGVGTGRAGKPMFVGEGRRTIIGYGRTERQHDRAALFARDNLDAFRAIANKKLNGPLSSFNYYPLKEFPSEAGYFEAWLCPYFNQLQPYKDRVSPQKINYIVRIYRRDGKESANQLEAFLSDRSLIVKFTFKNGKQVRLSADISSWIPRDYQLLQICWDPEKLSLYINEKLVKQAKTPGKLVVSNGVELGGVGDTASFQGLIDNVEISRDIPKSLLCDPNGDSNVFKILKATGDIMNSSDWRCGKGITIVPGSKPVFKWDGSAFKGKVASSKSVFPVKPGQYIRGDLHWIKHKWQFGSVAMLHIRFEDSEGKLIRIRRFDSSNSIPRYRPMAMIEFNTEAGIGVPLSYFNYWKVPDKATQIRPVWVFNGNPLQISLTELSFRKIDSELSPWHAVPPRVEQFSHKSPELSDAQVDEILKKLPRRHPELKRNGDRIDLYINGKRTIPAILCNFGPGSNRWDATYEKIGFPIFTTPVVLGRSCSYNVTLQVWREDNTYDIDALKKAVYKILRHAPKANVILALNISPTKSWLMQNQDQIMKNDKGENAIIKDWAVRKWIGYSKKFPDKRGSSWFPSVHSQKYRQDIKKILKEVLEKFEKTDASKAVIGIYVVGGDDGQFRYPDMSDKSKPAIVSFRNFLRKRYKNDDGLRRAWHNPKVSIDTVLPAEVPKSFSNYPGYGDSMETDLQRWTSYSSYELRDSMYAAVKAAAPRLLVGGYENAMGLTCQPGFGRYHINALLNSTTPDFMISLPGYGRYRDDCNHPIGLKVYNGSMVLHNKLLIYEMDIRNPEQGPLGLMCKSRNWQAEHNKSSFNNFIKLFTGTAMSWGGGFHAYLMQPHWWNTPAAIKTWTDAIKIAQNSQGCRLNNNRVAVMINEDSSFYAARKNIPAFFSRMNYKESTEYTLWKSGIRYDYYLPQDLFNPDFKAPKILFFADAQTMTPDDAQKIRKKYANSGRIIIWVGGAGYLPSGSIAAARAVTGFKIELDPRINNCPLWSSGKITDPLMKGISGFFYEWTYYCGGFSPHWKVDDPKAKTLACYYGTDIPGMAVKRYKKHTEIFIGQPGSISPQLMRNIARAAEIRPLLYSDDLFVTGAGLLSVGALTGNGIRKIYFPPGVKAMKCLTGQKITRTGKDFIELQMKYREAAVFKLFR